MERVDPAVTDTSTSPASIFRSSISLGLLALLGTALLTWVYWLAEPRIAEQERRQLLLQLEQVLPADRFNNAMHEDYIDVRNEAAFPGRQVVRVFRARQDEKPAAVVFRLIAPDGYNGRISLLVGILDSGKISGVRVLSHNETPGLGDGIEFQRSDWIRSFDGKSLNNPLASGWAVKRDGGDFDQFTGATITPRAVVRAVRRALEYFDTNRQSIFLSPSEFQAPQTNQGIEHE
jgi:electron transport complex protein RnfG